MKRYLVAVLFTFAVCLSLALAPHDGDDAPDAANYASPPGIGENGPFESHNIEVLGHLTLGEMGGGQANILGADIWGWTDPMTGKEYALCGLMHATSFVDISDPRNPQYLGRLLTQTGVSTWRDIKVYNDHAFIVSDNNPGHGMQVFDLTRLRTADPAAPQEFTIDAHYTGADDAHNVAINEDSGYAYIVGSGRANGGLHVVNIQDPLNPFEAGNFGDDGYTHDALIVNYEGPDPEFAGREIAFACNIDSLTLVDVTDKSKMTQVAKCVYPENGYSHQCWITEDHRYIYLGDEFDERNNNSRTRTIVFDIQDLDNPVYLGFHEGPTFAVDHNLLIKGDKLYQANYAAGMRVYQIDPNDPLNLTEIAWVDTFVTDDDDDFDGVWAPYPFFDSGSIVISDRQNGLFVVRLSELLFEYPGGVPALLEPDGAAEFTVQVTAGYGGEPVPNTGKLYVDQGNGFECSPMNEIETNLYEAVFPATPCGQDVRFYVSATSTNGDEVTFPSWAPSGFHTAKSAALQSFPFRDDFEVDRGWTVSGDAETGMWERGVPAFPNYTVPAVDADGSGSCFLTDNSDSFVDVDGGSVVLTSPIMDAVGDGTAETAFVNYYRWYYNLIGNGQAQGTFLVEISNDAGQNWTILETVGPGGHEVSGQWFYKSFNIEDVLTPTDQMQVRFCASEMVPAFIEAAVDGFEVQLLYCNDVLLGDVNRDGVVNLLDIDPFVDLLTNSEFQLEADMNGDGIVSLLDVALFVVALNG